ncbi:hypothetical protein K3495_g8351, partial [Podosphaera aphanis]
MSQNFEGNFQRPVDALTKSNWRQVFTDLKLWLESKGLFYVCTTDKSEYAAIGKDAPSHLESLTAAVAALNISKTDGSEPMKRKEQMANDRSFKWERDAAAVIYWLRQCCPHDNDIIEDEDTPKKAWNSLYAKYSKVNAGELRRLEREITSFDRGSQAPGKSPEECFALMKVLRRRFLLQKPEKKSSLSDENLFGYLLDSFIEPEWKLTKDTLDAQPNLGCDEKLDILQQLWERNPILQGTNDEEAMIAKNRWRNSRFPSRSVNDGSTSRSNQSSNWRNDRSHSPSRSPPQSTSRCYQCRSEEHRIETCPFKKAAKEWAYQRRLQLEREQAESSSRRMGQSKYPKYGRSSSYERAVRFSSPPAPKRGKAYAATDLDSEVYEEALDTEHEDGDIVDECRMAHDGTSPCKQSHSLTPVTWHPDTAASSHMSDNLKIFKGPLRPTRRTIKVGGGKLFCREMGDAWMVTERGVATLKDCLFVPGLGANLISMRKACENSDLMGSFNASRMYLYKGSDIMLTAHHQNGIYTVRSVAPYCNSSEIAFNSNQV